MNRGSPGPNQVQDVRSEPTVDTVAQKTLCSQPQERKPSLRSKIRQGLKNKLFRGVIIIDPRHVALTVAAKEVDLCANQGRSVYWTDGSRIKNSCCGIGVAYQSSTETWAELSWRIRGCVRTHVLEVYAIAKALEIAWEHCRNSEAEQRPSNIVIYCDCPAALEFFARFRLTLSELERLEHGEELVGPGIIASEGLNALEVEVELRYVPGHAGITGNLKADRAARGGARHSVGKQEAARLVNECVRVKDDI
jgi:ribonuclease HI